MPEDGRSPAPEALRDDAPPDRGSRGRASVIHLGHPALAPEPSPQVPPLSTRTFGLPRRRDRDATHATGKPDLREEMAAAWQFVEHDAGFFL